MIVFVSDIRVDDNRSSTKLLKPFFDELINYEHVVLSPNAFRIIERPGLNVISFWLPFYKNKNLLLRMVSELLLPIFSFFWLIGNKDTKIANINKIISYSPSIFNVFFIIFVNIVTVGRTVSSFLILRDIFPDWARDAGVIKSKYIFKFFKVISNLQFTIYDKVGVQDQASLSYIYNNYKVSSDIMVLPNWLEDTQDNKSVNSIFGWQSVFQEFDYNLIYTGNVGPAQDLGLLLQGFNNCDSLLSNNCAIHIFGDGLEAEILKSKYGKNGSNIYFWGQVSTLECEAALSCASAALFTLKNELRVNNVPGKYMQYTAFGLPLLAVVNPSNPVIQQIRNYNAGIVCSGREVADISNSCEIFLNGLQGDSFESSRQIYEDFFKFPVAAGVLVSWMKE